MFDKGQPMVLVHAYNYEKCARAIEILLKLLTDLG